MRTLVTFLSLLFLASVAQAQQIQRPKLTVTPLNDRVYVHTTYGIYRNTAVPSNGLIINTKNGVVLVDTGWDTDTNTDNTRDLLQWVATNLHQPVRLCIVTHAHEDRVGGISELRKAGIRAISTPLTAQKSVNLGYESPDGILPNDTTFTIGQEPIRCYFPGQGHTIDNIVVWLPNQRILHGGCLIKSVAAFGMGNLADANLNAWAGSVQHVIKQFGTAKIVVPGHDEWGDTKALEHTLALLKKHAEGKK
ncbi:subclass B1 metallo-beta-lactamase [Spirosoma sp. KCTC 42546]|uniref:subclass B1 metallo-beta-lactamase n=1 Tax=Spirosoma sp. KCTC 42546 TaxID=2520506 RepID=UPI001157A5B5|nr:subclass B1 metallo-beta-lactamase [Spirosoma sp. KCTC 42546]QDK81510.1 subclass B1 metallo-beta-lactamase [Spirosoma sp. KCTC 42546]